MANHQTRVYENILEMLSCEENPTPLLRLNKTVPFKHAKVYAKLEWYNPFGAVKDRIAANMIRDAEEKGLMADGQKLVEPTSGNTGMGLAMTANVKGYSLDTPLSKAIPVEKRVMQSILLPDEDAEIEPVPTAGGGHRPETRAGPPLEHPEGLEARERVRGDARWARTGHPVADRVE